MSFAEWRDFWWNSVTGPRTAVTKVVDLLLEKNMVALIVPADLPWRHNMRNAVEVAVKQKSAVSNMIFRQVDATDDCPHDMDPGRYLLQCFAPTEVCISYREKAGISLQKYMVQHAVLKNTIVWIKGLEAAQAGNWIKFCKEYAPPGIEDGLIILEIHGDNPIPDMRKIKTVQLTDFVCNYDLQLFNSFVLDENSSYTETWKQYVSTIAARLCGIDAEVSEKLVNIINFQSEEPLDGIRQIADMPEYEKRGQEWDQHVLACFRARDFAEIDKRIWSAQVQTLFPLIEFERMDIVRNWADEIQKALDFYTILQYNIRLTNPLDIELGTFVYHLSHKSDSQNYYIYIPDEAARNRIHFLHKCRNVLAHAKCLSHKQVYALIEGLTDARLLAEVS
jgi:hypothetical protein